MWHIAGGSYDGRLSVWDCNKKQNNDNTVCPLINLNYHKCEIEDVSYNKFHDCILASCDDNGFSAFWDTRDCAKTPFHKIQCHEQVQYGIQFSVSNEYNVATCGSDSLIKVWDIRNMKGPLFVGQQPNREQITQIQWSRESPTTIWAVSKNKAYLWDMGEQRIRFMHGGHRDRVQGGQANRINELCVNINQPDTVATVDANNEIHVFQPNQNCKI